MTWPVVLLLVVVCVLLASLLFKFAFTALCLIAGDDSEMTGCMKHFLLLALCLLVWKAATVWG